MLSFILSSQDCNVYLSLTYIGLWYFSFHLIMNRMLQSFTFLLRSFCVWLKIFLLQSRIMCSGCHGNNKLIINPLTQNTLLTLFLIKTQLYLKWRHTFKNILSLGQFCFKRICFLLIASAPQLMATNVWRSCQIVL